MDYRVGSIASLISNTEVSDKVTLQRLEIKPAKKNRNTAEFITKTEKPRITKSDGNFKNNVIGTTNDISTRPKYLKRKLAKDFAKTDKSNQVNTSTLGESKQQTTKKPKHLKRKLAQQFAENIDNSAKLENTGNEKTNKYKKRPKTNTESVETVAGESGAENLGNDSKIRPESNNVVKKKKRSKKADQESESTDVFSNVQATHLDSSQEFNEEVFNEFNTDDANAESDIDEDNPPKPKKSKLSDENKTVGEELDFVLDDRTIFVGNWPLSKNKKKLKQFFKPYGTIETVRFRSIPLADARVPKKVSAISKKFHPNRTSTNAYVRFTDEDSAIKAKAANGSVFEEHHIRVNLCKNTEKPEMNKAIFVGNINFDAEEDNLWNIFDCCGAIESVRIIRDKASGVSKGFGYVNFKSIDGVELALNMSVPLIKNRPLRIMRASGKIKKEKRNPQRFIPKKLKDAPVGRNNNYQGIQTAPKKKNKRPIKTYKKPVTKKIGTKSV